MRYLRFMMRCSTVVACMLATTGVARAQGQAQAADESRWAFDFGVGLDLSVNGNVNSGAVGRLNGLATALLPQSYADVYGTGIQLRFGGAFALNRVSEVRGIFTFQSADADLVRLGDIGPSSLYAQYSDYQAFGLDVGYRRYMPLDRRDIRIYGEATIGLGFIDAIDVELAAPQANVVFDSTDFYDQTAAFTWSFGAGVLFSIAEHLDLNAQVGLRHVSGLSEVDQFVGTGLEEINNDSGRLTFPVVVGIRYRF
jgi:hypothetical protein